MLRFGAAHGHLHRGGSERFQRHLLRRQLERRRHRARAAQHQHGFTAFTRKTQVARNTAGVSRPTNYIGIHFLSWVYTRLTNYWLGWLVDHSWWVEKSAAGVRRHTCAWAWRGAHGHSLHGLRPDALVARQNRIAEPGPWRAPESAKARQGRPCCSP